MIHQRYLNGFDPSKNYKKLLFIGGRGLQTSELNELQDIITNELARIGNYLIKRGSIISGGSVGTVVGNQVSIDNAVIYLDGYTASVASKSVALHPTELTIVGVVIKETSVTNYDDSSLNQSDPLSPNFGSPGAYRHRIIGEWVRSNEVPTDSKFFPVFTFSNGNLISSSFNTVDDYSLAASSLIEDYDSSTHGNYVLSGLDVTYVNRSGNKFFLQVNSGKARVGGKTINRPFSSVVELSELIELRTILSEPHVFTGPGTYNTRYIDLNEIIKLTVIVNVTRTITHGSYNTAPDLLIDTPVVEIKSITQGGTTFVKNVDFFQNGDLIDWSLSGANTPAPGSSYDVNYDYAFVLTPSKSGDSFVVPNTINIVPSSVMYIDYNHFLTRIDRLSIDKTGQVIITKGVAASRNPSIPAYTSNALSLATATISKSTVPEIAIDTVSLVKMSDLKDMKTDIEDIKFNVMQLSLLENARQMDPTTNKRGIIVDPLYDTDMLDLGSVNNCFIHNETLSPSILNTGEHVVDSFVTLPNTRSVFMDQPSVTSYRKINPYATAVFSVRPTITVMPDVLYANSWWTWFHGNFMPRATSYKISVSGFVPSEQVEFVGHTGSTIGIVTSDNTGSASINVPVAAGIQLGTYKVTATGRTSGSIATGSIKMHLSPDRIGGDWGFNWNGGEVSWGADPISQTFTVDVVREVSGVTIPISELPTSNLVVKLVTTIAGIPDKNNVLTSGQLLPGEIISGLNFIKFKSPVRVVPGVEYALIVVTPNSQGTVGVAKLGTIDQTTGTWVLSQTNDGVLLISANESTWTPVQDEDLSFKLHSNTYASQQKILVKTITATGVTDWTSSCTVDQPAGTEVSLELEHLSNTYYLPVNGSVVTPPLTGSVKVYAILKTSNTRISPKILPGMVISTGVVELNSVYTQRAFQIPNYSLTPAKIRVFLDILEPAGSTVTPSIEISTNIFSPLIAGTPVNVGFGYKQIEFSLPNVAKETSRLRILMKCTNPESRPSVKKIRILVE